MSTSDADLDDDFVNGAKTIDIELYDNLRYSVPA